jgi:MFS family permease
LTYPVIQGREAGWPWQTWACLIGSAASFWLFIRIERRLEVRGASPLIPLALFRQRSFSLGIVLVLALYALIYSYNLTLSVTMQDGLGLSALDSGLVQAPQATAILVFSLIAARFVPRYGLLVMKAGILIMIAGFLAAGVMLVSGTQVTPLVVLPALIVQGIGAGMVVPQSLSAVLSRIEPESAGVASGILSTTQQCGGALGVAIIGTVFFGVFHSGTSGKVVAATHAFAAASFGVTVFAVIAAVVVYLLPKTPAGQR